MQAKNNTEFNADTVLSLLEQTSTHIYAALARIESRIDKLEDKFDKLSSKADNSFYVLLTIYLGGFGSIFAILAKRFNWY